MTFVRWNINAPRIGRSIPEPSQDAIENTLNLNRASLEDAVRYGGTITRDALGAMDLKYDRKYVVVDTKVHFLLPGFIPAIPGWHTDGVPRGEEMDPGGTGKPNLRAQYEGRVSSSHYHLLVTGTHCPTRFVDEQLDYNMDLDAGSELYANLTRMVNQSIQTWNEMGDPVKMLDTPNSTVVEWDWWNIHTAQRATARGWRYLIRVTETDYIAPRTDPSKFIRRQNQVYAPAEFGW